MLLFFTMISAVEANKTDTFRSISKTSTGTWITSAASSSSQPLAYWLHYDDGSCENSLGLTAGGTLYEVIKLTPEELGPYNGCAFFAYKVMHGCPAYPGCPGTPFTAWIYYGVNHPNDPETEATIIETGYCPAMDDYFYINFSTPYEIHSTDTVWLGVGWEHPAGTYPCGFDTDSCISGKSDFLWFPGGNWYELGGIGYPGNWNFEVLVDTDGHDESPPTTTCDISGTNPVTITLSAVDPDDGVMATFYKIDNANNYTQYLSPIIYDIPGRHTITFYSIDHHENQEVPKTKNFSISNGLTIGIKGGLGITVSIHNTGSVDVPINGSITVTGYVIPKTKAISGTVPAGEDMKFKDMVFGIGPTTITVRLGDQVVKKDAAVLLVFVILNT